MERDTPVEEDTIDKIINDMSEFYVQGFSRMFGIVDRKIEQLKQEESRHNDIKEKGTYLHEIYLHSDHVLLLDWLLNYAMGITDIPYGIELVKQLKKVIEDVLNKIYEKERKEINKKKNETKQNEERIDELERLLEQTIEQVLNIKQYLYDKYEKKPKFKCSVCGMNCLRKVEGSIQWGCRPPCKGKIYASTEL